MEKTLTEFLAMSAAQQEAYAREKGGEWWDAEMEASRLRGLENDSLPPVLDPAGSAEGLCGEQQAFVEYNSEPGSESEMIQRIALLAYMGVR